MLREKKELQTMREQEQDEQTTSPPLEASIAKEQSPATTTAAATQPQREHLVDSQLQNTTHHQDHTVEDSSKVQQPLQVNQSLPSGGNQNYQEERKIEKRASVSERRKMFEAQFGGGGLQDKKLAIRGREKTPGHLGTQDRDKNFNNSSTPLSHKPGDSNAPKRFTFVPKHVAPYDDDARLPTDSKAKPVAPKRSSSDGRTTKNISVKPPLFSSNSANEIRESQHFNDNKTSTDFHEHNKQQTNFSVVTKATTPINKKPQHTLSSPNFKDMIQHPQQVIVNHDEHLHEDVTPATTRGDDSSVLSSTLDSTSSGFTTPDSSVLSERGSISFSRLHSEEAEAKRRVTAKKKREARRVTQPVDNELLRLISKEDTELEHYEDKLQVEAEQLADKLKPKVNNYYVIFCMWCV